MLSGLPWKYLNAWRLLRATGVLGTTCLIPAMASSESLPLIEVYGIVPSSISETPGAAAVLDRDDMDAMRAYTLHDLLDSVAGLRTIDDDALGRRTAIGVRGAPPRRSRKTLLLEDGVPINLSAYIDPSVHYTPPMERLAGVDVLKGAGQILHGPLNNHGIVNFRNRQATDSPETTLGLAAGSLSTFRRHITHTRTAGPVGLVMAYSGTSADGTFDVESTRFDDLYVSGDWQLDQRQSLAFSLTHHRERSDYDESNLTPAEFAVAPDRKQGRFGQEYNSFGLDYSKITGTYGLDLGDRVSLVTRVFATDADRPRFTADPGMVSVGALPEIGFVSGAGAFSPGDNGVMVSRDRHYRTRGLDARVFLDSAGDAPVSHSWQWGLRAEQHALNDMRSAGAVGERLHINNRGPKTRDVEYRAEAVSVFVEDVISAGNWQITPGLRAEYYTQSKHRLSIAADRGPHAPLESDHNFLLLPGISVLYRGQENTQWFANLARGYTPAPARTAAAFPLLPETGINSQLGLRTQVSELTSVEGALFYNRISNTIVQLPFSVDGMSLLLNSADSDSMGADLAVSWRSTPLGEHGTYLFSRLAYNYTRAVFNGDFGGAPLDGNRVPEVSDHVGSLTAGLGNPAGWQASVTLSQAGGFYTDPLNTRDIVLTNSARQALGDGDTMSLREPYVLGRVPGHQLLSARITYALPHAGATVWLQGRNLTDRRYLSDLENGMRPGASRSIMVGVELQL